MYSFKEQGHQHLWNGKRMTGVTTVLGVIAKPALIGWAANMAVDYILNDVIPTKDEEEYTVKVGVFKKLCEEARKAHTKKKEAAADIGTIVHKACEEWIKEQKEPTLDEQGTKMFNNFRKWLEDNKVKVLESEKHLWSESKFLGGICDLVVEIDNQVWIADIKTGGVYPEAIAQMAAYGMMLKEMGEKYNIVGHIILGIKKDGTFQEHRSISNEDGEKMFLAAYDIYRIQQKLNSLI